VRIRIAAGAVAALLLGLLVWGFVIEPDRLVVHEARLALPRWPPELAGLRIAVLADVHAGAPHVDVDKVGRIVAIVEQMRPDLVVLLGDYVAGFRRTGLWAPIPPEDTARVLASLHPPLGVFAVLGNHDWWFDGARVRDALRAADIVVLENEAVPVTRDGEVLWLVGLADLWTRWPDVAGALRGVPDGAPAIVLSHNPDVFPEVPSRVALTLAGHTHGGQVLLPLIGRPVVPSRYGQRYAAGHVVEDGRHLFVTTGIGTSIIPIRLGVPPEIVVLTIAGVDVTARSARAGFR
jgi:predicted MPP superfamily phosphohydrolase